MENKHGIETSQKKQGIFKVLLSVFSLLFVLQAFPGNTNFTPPPDSIPLHVNILLHVNKIYDINTIDETYKIDGYLEYSWFDSRLTDTLTGVYENEQVDELMNKAFWFPAFEIINIQGEKEVPNKSVEISSGGKVSYYERFFGTFDTYMDFKKFPFDDQHFKIEIEAFSYDTTKVVFKNLGVIIGNSKRIFTEEWGILGKPKVSIILHEYPVVESKEYYSRAVFEIDAKRLIGYYLWEVLFPLFIIILASFVIFWIKDFGTQIGIGFTLMLTVVAFNFYSASILPKLPYQTFIETVIFIGYVFIFLGILAVIVNYRLYGDKDKEEFNRLIKIFRYVFPVTFIVVIVLMFYVYGIF